MSQARANKFADWPMSWRKRAEELRTKADVMSHKPSRDQMLKIAMDWERIGEMFERNEKIRRVISTSCLQ